MVKLDFYWQSNPDWYYQDEKNYSFKVRPDAPKEAQESYKHYLEQKKKYRAYL